MGGRGVNDLPAVHSWKPGDLCSATVDLLILFDQAPSLLCFPINSMKDRSDDLEDPSDLRPSGVCLPRWREDASEH